MTHTRFLPLVLATAAACAAVDTPDDPAADAPSPQGGAVEGYFWWQYSTNGFMNAAYLPNDGTDATNYPVHYNYAYRPVSNVSHADTLVLFLPGAGARTDSYTQFYQEAVNRGFFVVGLDYINDHDLTGMCTSNVNCAGLMDEQVVMGTSHGFWDRYFGAGGLVPGKASYNSVVNRFGYFLKWIINSADPAGAAQWSQFCQTWNANGTCDTPAWSNIIIAGHSHGGAVSWWILKNKGAKKGIALSAPSARMNTALVTPVGSDFTPFTTNPNPSDAPYGVFDNGNQYAGKLRVFLDFYDWRYKPGVTVPGEPTSANPNWDPNEGKNQPGNLVDIGKHETRLWPTSICDTTNWTQWITAMEVGDNGATHGAPAANGDGWETSAPGFRSCVWDYLLEH
jgi:hypothetical protein